MQSREIDPEFEKQFKALLESNIIPNDQLIRFNELVTSVIDNISEQDQINVKKIQDKDFDKMAGQIIDRMFKTDLLGEPIQLFKAEYNQILDKQSDVEKKKNYSEQLKVIEEIESQLKEGSKDRISSVLERLEVLGDIPPQLLDKFNM